LDFLAVKTCTKPTEILSSNVVFAESSALFADQRVKPYSIVEKGGEKIGLIGVTAAKKTKGSSRPDADTTFTDEVLAVQKAIDALQTQGVNKIVLQSHIGYAEDLALVGQLKGVDVVIGGDSHSLLAPKNIEQYGLAAQGDYPTLVQDAIGKKVCVAQAWQYAAVVGELNVQFNAQGDVMVCNGRPHVLVGHDFQRVDGLPLTASQLNVIKKDLADSQIFSIVQPDAKALQILEPYRVAKTLFGQQQVAWVEANLCLRRVPGYVRDLYRSALGDVCNQNEFNHAHGGDIQQIVAEAFLQQGKKYFQADVALINGGGVREDLAQGNIDVDQIYRVLAFKNTLEQLSLTGNELHMMLEDAMQAVLDGHTGSYPYTGGLRWQVDLNQPFGSRLSNLEIWQNGIWQPLQPQHTYQLITIDFLADGQGGYDTLKTIAGERRVNVGLDYTEAFLQYLEDLPQQNGKSVLKPLSLDLYSTQKFIDRVDEP
jgi:5'-nucleotidase / UDP-sugar diphosphatase